MSQCTRTVRAALAILLAHAALIGDEVVVARTPGGGIQPDVVADAAGTVHLLSFTGDAAGGDLDYRCRPRGAAEFTPPIRVDSVPRSALAIGTIRGGHLAIGRDGWVHVAWMGSKAATAGDGVAPMLYARLPAGGAAFEPQRNLITWAPGLDGGGSVAADATGRVFVAWHGDPAKSGEADRAVFVALSKDDGRTFAKEVQPVAAKTGACACCGMRAAVDADGTLYLAYRGAAAGGTQRDFLLASLAAKASTPAVAALGAWKIPMCPMSTCAVVRAREGMLAAWEDEAGLHWARVAKGRAGRPVLVAAGGKHPALAETADGGVLVAWAEGSGWERGGTLRWRRYGPDGATVAASQGDVAIPTWSRPAVVAAQGVLAVWY